MVKSMFLFKLKMAAVGLTAALVVGSGAGVVTYHTAAAHEQKADQSVEDRLRDEIARLKKELVRAEKEIAKLKQERTYVKVAAQREGVMGFVGTLLKDSMGNETNKVRPLKVGDHIELNQLLARIDDRLARDEMAIKEKKLAATESDLVISEKTRDEAKARYDIQVYLYNRKSTSTEEVRAAKLAWDKYLSEVETKKAAIQVAKAELDQARTVVEMHNIRSPVRGVIKSIPKHPGEAVKSLETVFVIQPDEK